MDDHRELLLQFLKETNVSSLFYLLSRHYLPTHSSTAFLEEGLDHSLIRSSAFYELCDLGQATQLLNYQFPHWCEVGMMVLTLHSVGCRALLALKAAQ